MQTAGIGSREDLFQQTDKRLLVIPVINNRVEAQSDRPAGVNQASHRVDALRNRGHTMFEFAMADLVAETERGDDTLAGWHLQHRANLGAFGTQFHPGVIDRRNQGNEIMRETFYLLHPL